MAKRRRQQGISPGQAYLRRKGLESSQPPPELPRAPEPLPEFTDEQETSAWYERDRYSPEAVRNTIARYESERGESLEVAQWLDALGQLEATYRSGRQPSAEQFDEAERARQTVQRRQRGVRPLAEWRELARNEPQRERVLELYRLGFNLVAIASDVGLSRTRVRMILREEDPDANPMEDWRASVRNEPLRHRVVTMYKTGASISAISREAGVARSWVRRLLIDEGVYKGQA